MNHTKKKPIAQDKNTKYIITYIVIIDAITEERSCTKPNILKQSQRDHIIFK